MPVCLVTGSGGLVGSEAARFFANRGFDVAGVDNDMRAYFFGSDASTSWQVAALGRKIPGYTHYGIDIRDEAAVQKLFAHYGRSISVVIHCAAQPSHDWAARDPITDFDINARGTLLMLEATRKHSPEATFIFTSTNKVYGDSPNHPPLIEFETRWELDASHPWYEYGIDETMSLDRSTHSVFGASKVAADVMVQEYGHYFGMKTAVFRGGCLTGSGHSGAELHGFLAYLVKCGIIGTAYTVFGYKGKQVRDNIHASDLVNMFWHFAQAPRCGEVYNAGGGRHSNCSMLEAITLCEKLTGKPFNWTYANNNRIGDHTWWISDVSRFRNHYPNWDYSYTLEEIMSEIIENLSPRL